MDSQAKVRKFLDEYKKLVEKYDVDFATFPQFVPAEDGSFKIITQTVPLDLEQQRKAKNDFSIPKAS